MLQCVSNVYGHVACVNSMLQDIKLIRWKLVTCVNCILQAIKLIGWKLHLEYVLLHIGNVWYQLSNVWFTPKHTLIYEICFMTWCSHVFHRFFVLCNVLVDCCSIGKFIWSLKIFQLLWIILYFEDIHDLHW